MVADVKRRTKLLLGSAVVVAVVGGGAGIGLAATVGDDQETPITGSALEQARAAALAHTGGGRVTGTEVGDEESYYEVEVTLASGGQVDVQLDEHFNVVSQSGDDDRSEPNDSADD
jgi:hypothetical protein